MTSACDASAKRTPAGFAAMVADWATANCVTQRQLDQVRQTASYGQGLDRFLGGGTEEVCRAWLEAGLNAVLNPKARHN